MCVFVCVMWCPPSLDKPLVNDAPKELPCDLQLLVRELGEKLVLIKHVLQHASEHLLWGWGWGWGGVVQVMLSVT